jgi:PEGA domain-containing protein
MAHSDNQPLRERLTRLESSSSRLTSLAVVSIAVLSAAAAFGVVRTWFVPVRAAAVIPATLSVVTDPSGADVLIDRQPRGRTPVTLAIDPGLHSLAVRAAGVERTVPLTFAAAAQVSQYFDLTPRVRAVSPGRLSIVTDPPGARVAIDGTPRGTSPLVVDDLTAAEHTVSVVSDAGSVQRTIAVTNGATKEVVFSLPRASAPTAGWIAVASPFPVDVIEHNEVIGTSGVTRIMSAAGRHDVVLRNQTIGYEAPRTIDVVPGRVMSVTVIPPDGRLNLNARPWADVLIDGVAAGQTPLANITVPVGPHQVTFRHPQLGERIERVVVTTNAVNRVAVDLTR